MCLHEAFYIARSGRPGPVVVDIPKDIQFAKGTYVGPARIKHRSYNPRLKGDPDRIKEAVDLMVGAKKPMIYSGGGVINSGPRASALFRELVTATGFPITSTLIGLGAFPASDKHFLGLVGMHGTYESNLAMHDCDVMIAVGSRFDDRVTGKIDMFSPGSQKIHIDIDPSSINKNVHVEVPIIGDCAHVLEDMLKRVALASGKARCRGAESVVGRDRRVGAARTSLAFKNPRPTSSSRNTRSSGSTN